MASGRPPDRDLLAENYRILEPLDARGRVFKAHDRRHRRVVAVRFLPLTAMSPSEREVGAARRVRHPNVAALVDVGQDGPTRFVVLEFAEGIDLERIVRDRGRLPLGQAVDVVTQAARGLEAAHARGIVHGGLKPSRLVLDAEGRVRVLGVGLSGLDDADEDPRVADFRAPELAEAPGRTDPRGDVYSLGCLLYFLLTGREPFVGETLEDRRASHRDRPPPELRVLRPDVPSTLAEAYQRMMAKRPEDRPGSMTEVLGLLRSAEGADAVGSSRPSSGEAERKGRSRATMGPEFDLGGLGLEGRPRAEPAPSRRSPIGVRAPSSDRLASASTGRWVRPAAAVGLAALAVVGAVIARTAFRSGGAGPIPQSATSDAGREPDRGAGEKTEPLPQPEWVSRTIFDGKDATDWMLTSKRPVPRKNVQPDGLNPHGTGSFLVVYQHKLGDFILDFDYRLSPGSKSGVFLRVGDLDDPVNTGLEVAIADTTGTSEEAPGALHGLVPPVVNAQKPAGEWNHMTITAQGAVIAVSLNGRDVSRIRLDEWTEPGRRPGGGARRYTRPVPARLPRRGYLGFQDLVGDCWFRDVVLRTPKTTPEHPSAGSGR